MKKRRMVGLILAAGLVLVAVLVWRFRQPETLVKQVMEDMSAARLVPQKICTVPPAYNEGESAYQTIREYALLHLLAAPAAQNMSPQELESVFNQGVEVATGTQDGVHFIAQHQSFILVNMKLPFCQTRHNYPSLPPMYVFRRNGGDYWSLGNGIIQSMEWIENRWVGTIDMGSSSGMPSYTLVHLVLNDWNLPPWQVRRFWSFPADPQIVFKEGYHKIMIPAESVRASDDFTYGELPCDFGDNLRDFVSLGSCKDCPVTAQHAIYRGDLTFVWAYDDYILTDETPYEVRVVLSDYSFLQEEPPSEAELAEKASYLRPGSWRDYCQVADQEK